MSLKEYNRKRRFDRTPEPPGKPARRRGELRFVVQLHRATRLHFDFRIEMGGSFKSWAVPRGPSLNPMDQRLAVYVEDHPIAYGSFEGIIPKGNYGAGTVMIWDQGTYRERGSLDASPAESEKAMLAGLEKGHMTFVLEGERLRGEFALIHLKKDPKTWLLVKKRDEHSTHKRPSEEEPTSAATGRTLGEIAAQAEKKGEVWLPKREHEAKLQALPETKPRGPKKKTPVAPKAKQLPDARAARKLTSRKKAAAPKADGKFPRRVPPMLAKLDRVEPRREGWLFTSLAGGFRALAEAESSRAHLYSKRQLSLDRKAPAVLEALRRAGLDALLDGELSEDGQRYRVFDLLYVDGADLREIPLRDRLARLKKLALPSPRVELAETVASDGSKLDGASVLARAAGSAYQGGISPEWVEIRGEARAARDARDGRPAERGPVFTHLEKIYFKSDGLTKRDLIEYYRAVAPALLPHLEGRPMSLHRFPDGADRKGFYQKDFTGHKPRFVETHRLYSESAGKSVDYVLCQNEATLLYLANLGCIEMNPWLSRVGSLEKPDYLVIDLDPDRQTFAQVVDVAHEVRKVLERSGAECYAKTSGATGMHVCVPLGARFDYEVAREYAEAVCRKVQEKLPALTTLERSPGKRGGRMYLDYLQNRVGQTLASAYSVRPRPGAPVATPLKWSEVTRKLDPSAFTMRTLPRRLDRLGDLWRPLLERQVDVAACLKKL